MSSTASNISSEVSEINIENSPLDLSLLSPFMNQTICAQVVGVEIKVHERKGGKQMEVININ